MNSAAAVTADVVMDTAATRRPPSMLGYIIADTLARWGARVGLAWIGLLALIAVLAPIIASSHPIVMKIEGRWSSPMFAHLTAVDVTLIVAAVLVPVVIAIRNLVPRHRVLVWFGGVLVTAVAAMIFVSPPKVVVYERYRERQAAGQLEYVARTLIPYSPSDRLRDREGVKVVGPWWSGADFNHWLGTEPTGGDVATRMNNYSRIALAVGFIATGIAVVIGVFLGGIMGYFSGVVDLIGMRLLEIFEFIPQLFLLLMFVAFFERNIYMIMAIIGLTSWAGYARFVRAEFLKLRDQDFVRAAVACGLPIRSILFRHMLPNGMAPILVGASFGVASAILAEAVLSFLGLGLVDQPSWGQLLNQALTAAGGFSWWIAIFPGLAIFLTVFSYNMVGEALRDAIDPHTKRQSQL